MNIELAAKGIHTTDMLKSRIEQKLGKIEARLGHKLFIRVKLTQANERYTCSIHFTAHNDFNATATSSDLVKAADEAIHKIERQVNKAQQKNETGRHDDTLQPQA